MPDFDIVLSVPGPVEIAPGSVLVGGIGSGCSINAVVQKARDGEYGGRLTIRQGNANLYGTVRLSPYGWAGDLESEWNCCLCEGLLNYMGKPARLTVAFKQNKPHKALSEVLWNVKATQTQELLSLGFAVLSGVSVTVPMYSGISGGG